MDKRIEKAYDIIKRRYQDKLQLEDLAAKVNLSPFYFQRLFKKEMKETPAACLMRIRLERSAHLIKANSGWSMSEIAADCGFSSLSSFSRAFSHKFRMSPQAFGKDDKSSMKIVVQERDLKPFDVKIEYFPDRFVFYNRTSIANPHLFKEFGQARAFCEMNGIETLPSMIGVTTHTTFHYPEDPFNYYAGVEIPKANNHLWPDRVFVLAAGKYACFDSTASCKNFQGNMLRFKMEWIDPSPYAMRDLYCFEEIDSSSKTSDYPFLKRRVHVPIAHK